MCSAVRGCCQWKSGDNLCGCRRPVPGSMGLGVVHLAKGLPTFPLARPHPSEPLLCPFILVCCISSPTRAHQRPRLSSLFFLLHLRCLPRPHRRLVSPRYGVDGLVQLPLSSTRSLIYCTRFFFASSSVGP